MAKSRTRGGAGEQRRSVPSHAPPEAAASRKRRRLEVVAMVVVIVSSLSSWFMDEGRSGIYHESRAKPKGIRSESKVEEEAAISQVFEDRLISTELSATSAQPYHSAVHTKSISEHYMSFRIVDLRAKRAPAYFNAELRTKMSLIFEAYGKLRNFNDGRCFFYNAQRQLLSADMNIEEAISENGSTLSVIAIADHSELCGSGLSAETSLNLFSKKTDPLHTARMARLFLGCSLADVAEPDWRRHHYHHKKYINQGPISASLHQPYHSKSTNLKNNNDTIITMQTPTKSHASQRQQQAPRKTDNNKRLGQATDSLYGSEEINNAAAILCAQSGLNPFELAEEELREALRLSSRGARVALARLVVVAAHFEARPTFLEDARAALASKDENAFIDAVATGTRIAGAKASRLLAAQCKAEDADTDAVAAALAAGAVVDFRTDDFGRATVLHWAAYRGHASVISSLLAAGADPTIRNDQGLTPLDLVQPESEAALAFANAGFSIEYSSQGAKLPLAANDDLPLNTIFSTKYADFHPTVKKEQHQHIGKYSHESMDSACTILGYFAPYCKKLAHGFNAKIPSSRIQCLRLLLHLVSFACLGFLAVSSYNELAPSVLRSTAQMYQVLNHALKQIRETSIRIVHCTSHSFVYASNQLCQRVGAVSTQVFLMVKETLKGFRRVFIRTEQKTQSVGRPTTPIARPAAEAAAEATASQSPPVQAQRKKSAPKQDLADHLAELDLSALSRDTLDKLDKLLPELQRRVLREVLAREAPASLSSPTPEASECMVCLENSRSVAFGCGHLCVCNGCAEGLTECPVCRAPVTSRHRIYNTT